MTNLSPSILPTIAILGAPERKAPAGHALGQRGLPRGHWIAPVGKSPATASELNTRLDLPRRRPMIRGMGKWPRRSPGRHLRTDCGTGGSPALFWKA